MAAKTGLTATFKCLEDMECAFAYGVFDCGESTSNQDVTLNGETIRVCDDCANKLEELFEMFGIKIDHQY